VSALNISKQRIGKTVSRVAHVIWCYCCRDSAVAPRRRRPMGVEYRVVGVAENYLHMGSTLGALLLVLFTIYLVRT
jgi:hypothetical protein